ncbi:MAG TPA: ABC transporter permease [Longimicrobiales bacterium]|nr:ABC transporter permease [Longimicrobiales bacterium]
MSRMVPVIKREFTEAVGSKAFVIGTILGPLLIFGLFGLQFLVLAKAGGGEHRIALIDATDRGVGERVVQQINERDRGPSFIERATYTLTVEPATVAAKDEVIRAASERVVAKELDGFLWIPPDVLTGATVEYEGSNATNTQVTGELQRAVQRIVQSERLRTEGIDEDRLGGALEAVPMNVVKTGERGQVGNPEAAMLLAFGMAFAIYIVVIMYGQSIMTSVQEEKRDRIVELIVSSVRARDLLIGKVVGIGAAGVLQMLIWVAAAGLLLTQGALIAGAMGASESTLESLSQGSALPSVPLSVGVAFVLYFAGGFLLFATLFAIIGAIVTNSQEAQQFVFPVLMPFVLGLFIAMAAAQNPNSSVAVIGSIVPFTSPMVMPVRISVAGVDWVQMGISLVLLFATAAAIIWLAAKIYRVAIFATGQKPTGREIMRWMKAA